MMEFDKNLMSRGNSHEKGTHSNVRDVGSPGAPDRSEVLIVLLIGAMSGAISVGVLWAVVAWL